MPVRDRLRRLIPTGCLARWLLIAGAVSVLLTIIVCLIAVALLLARGEELIPYPDGPPPINQARPVAGVHGRALELVVVDIHAERLPCQSACASCSSRGAFA